MMNDFNLTGITREDGTEDVGVEIEGVGEVVIQANVYKVLLGTSYIEMQHPVMLGSFFLSLGTSILEGAKSVAHN